MEDNKDSRPATPSSEESEARNKQETLLDGSLGDIQKNISNEDMEFMSDTSAAMLIRTPQGGRLLVYTILMALGTAVIWACFAKLDEITRGSGSIVPSSRLQVIQNLEGGILKELYVEEGDRVNAGQPLLQLDDTQFRSDFREGAIEHLGLLAKSARLKAELSGEPLKFPPELHDYPDYMQRERDIFEQRESSQWVEQSVIEKQILQAKHDFTSTQTEYDYLKKSYQLGAEELKLTKPLAEQGVVSQVELLQLEQKVNDLDSQRRLTQLSLPKLQAAYEEAVARQSELREKFREDAVHELQEVEVKLGQRAESQSGVQDQVDRTLVRAPLSGIVKKINITTIGGVVQPGMEMMEIVPIEDSLLVEVNINPKDIGFLRKGMPAVVKLTAYDFAIYGGLDGTLEHISADTIENEKGESFYVARVRTKENYLGTAHKRLDVMVGMQTSVDIITGEKTVMQYLLKPLLRAKQNALTER
ncbi:HlyD family type I secretion periplasmic adaptor subunit [Candidatus Sororendozoicomonas aggregata]|uniref:HlyD family type I secretion periplasmic adaptor subunit n=1 Tax=Candidatus Sororendozoicomonas aggregata TaxID=3073239 RepID=UPI002ED1B6AB